MKTEKIKCPSCGKTANLIQIEKATLFSDEFYDVMKEQHKDGVLLSSVCDNVIYRCNCENCNKYFSAMVILDTTVKDVIVDYDQYSLIRLRKSDKDYLDINLISADEAKSLSGIKSKEEFIQDRIFEINSLIKEAIKFKKRTVIVESGVAGNTVDAPYEILGSEIVERLEKAGYKITAEFLKVNENNENIYKVIINF